jgi:hypothetical protein
MPDDDATLLLENRRCPGAGFGPDVDRFVAYHDREVGICCTFSRECFGEVEWRSVEVESSSDSSKA